MLRYFCDYMLRAWEYLLKQNKGFRSYLSKISQRQFNNTDKIGSK